MFSFDSHDGLKTIVAKAAAGDAIWFLATVNRIAEILAARGDTNPIGTRRARAVGILARPAEALRLLIEHQHGPACEPETTCEHEPAGEDEPDVEPDDHQSQSMAVPSGFDALGGAATGCAPLPPIRGRAWYRSRAGAARGRRPRHPRRSWWSSWAEPAVRSGVQPLLDPTEVAPVDGYEVPQRLRAVVRARQIADVSPSEPVSVKRWT